MEVQIISRETIKPSSPTPHRLKTYNLSHFDRLALGPPANYIPLIFFYSAGERNPGKIHISDHLKKSLSKALTHFYPLAGRVKDALTIDCSDEGVPFVEAHVACDISFVLEDPEINVLQQLLPCNRLEHYVLTHDQSSADRPVLLAVQANYFACGGIAIGVCISHIIADASAAVNFVKGWAEVASGADIIEDMIYDCSSLFPPQDLSVSCKIMGIIEDKTCAELPEDEVVVKRFLFDGTKIAALRDEMGDNGLNSYRPTRVEAVTALLWEALIAATAANVGSSNSPIFDACNAVNLRQRMNPPLPKRCIGNVSFFPMILNKKIENRRSLARTIHESIKEIDDEYIRKMFSSSECFNDVEKKLLEELEKNISNRGMFCFSSWCKFPVYETDFGWGNPIWFGSGLKFNRQGCFVDTSDGEGIEAWMTMSKEEMIKFQQQPGILAYSTFKPSI